MCVSIYFHLTGLLLIIVCAVCTTNYARWCLPLVSMTVPGVELPYTIDIEETSRCVTKIPKCSKLFRTPEIPNPTTDFYSSLKNGGKTRDKVPKSINKPYT
jgi:hypothetical protein